MNLHFWMHTIGLLLYVTAMWIAGVTAGYMWLATGDSGSLMYTFMDSLRAIHPFYIARFVGGLLVMGGMIVMAWNLWFTAAAARAHLLKPIAVPVPDPEPNRLQGGAIAPAGTENGIQVQILRGYRKASAAVRRFVGMRFDPRWSR